MGFVTNTNQQWLCRELSKLGYEVSRQTAVSDQSTAIRDAVAEALGRADVVITTGGLGPTSDDLTRQVIAELFHRRLKEDRAVLARIEELFRLRQRAMPPSTQVQALVPEGAQVLPNSNGTAPGLVLESGRGQFGTAGAVRLLIMLPGPPRELEPMFISQVIPILRDRLPTTGFRCSVLRSTGLGESAVEEKIAGPLRHLTEVGLDIGYCARFGEVDVRLVARGPDADKVVKEAEQRVRELMGRAIFGTEVEQLESVIIRELTRRQQNLALAESCTGGYLANRLTNVPGASAVLLGGLVTYSNQSKQDLLGVRAETLAVEGAVSESTAQQLAEGARERLNASYALAITGIAGPSGGSAEKPVGTVYIALAMEGSKTEVLHRINRYDRESFKFVTSQQALDLLRLRLD
jgi:nicotinamide-nucleotide amidase